MGYDYVKIKMKFTLLTPVKSAAPFHLRENLTGQAPVKSGTAFNPSTIYKTYPSTICRSYGASGEAFYPFL
jgi:hypothetical protein